MAEAVNTQGNDYLKYPIPRGELSMHSW